MNLVVKARRASKKAHANGIFANFEVDVVENGDAMIRLYDGVLRRNEKDGRWWISGPYRQAEVNGKTAYYKHWRFFPEADANDGKRDAMEQWVIGEILKAIPDPTVALEDAARTGNAQPSQSRPAQRGAGAPFAAQPAAAAAAPPWGNGGTSASSGGFPFPTS